MRAAQINNTGTWGRKAWAAFIVAATTLFVGVGLAYGAWADDFGRWWQHYGR